MKKFKNLNKEFVKINSSHEQSLKKKNEIRSILEKKSETTKF